MSDPIIGRPYTKGVNLDVTPRLVGEEDMISPVTGGRESPTMHQQVGGDHYKKYSIQPWHIIDVYGLGYYAGNVLKYLLRHRDKNGLEDLRKARHYLDKLIETEEQRNDK